MEIQELKRFYTALLLNSNTEFDDPQSVIKKEYHTLMKTQASNIYQKTN